MNEELTARIELASVLNDDAIDELGADLVTEYMAVRDDQDLTHETLTEMMELAVAIIELANKRPWHDRSRVKKPAWGFTSVAGGPNRRQGPRRSGVPGTRPRRVGRRPAARRRRR